MSTPLSILDLAPVPKGATPREALHRSRDLARHAEDWGYTRFWLAEHHNMVGIASAATSVAIGYVAEGTSRIRVGSGGIMLPNHSPLVIAEQFGTLESLYPGRIDLGLGRAPGTDQITLRALRRAPEAGGRFSAATCSSCRRCLRKRVRISGCARCRARACTFPVDSGFQHIRRAARGHAGVAICVRLPLRA